MFWKGERFWWILLNSRITIKIHYKRGIQLQHLLQYKNHRYEDPDRKQSTSNVEKISLMCWVLANKIHLQVNNWSILQTAGKQDIVLFGLRHQSPTHLLTKLLDCVFTSLGSSFLGVVMQMYVGYACMHVWVFACVWSHVGRLEGDIRCRLWPVPILVIGVGSLS